MAEHDNSYKLLFSHPEMVESLLRDFVHEDWVERVDFSTLKRSNSSYVSDDLRDRADDIIWRVNIDGSPVYLYLLLEFQSRVDPWMALRIMVYVGLLYQDLIREQKGSSFNPLPPVFPMVIYNGERRWTAPRDVRELIAPMTDSLNVYLPSLKYFLLDEGQIASIQGESLSGLMGDVIRLESSGDKPEDLRLAIKALREHLQGDSYHSLRRAFRVWIERVVIQRVASEKSIVEYGDLEDIESMLAEKVDRWTEKWKREGIEQGIEQGVEIGEIKALSSSLRKICSTRFGVTDLGSKLENASLAQLQAWFDRALDAEAFEDVFAEDARD